MAQSEVSMEWALIKQLTGDVSQWTYRKDIVDEESLWANFRAKLNQNNLAVLDGEPVTDAEFHQIREYMLDVAKTPYKAALWLAGENGEAVIPLTREDAAKGTIHLMAVSNREIAGGRSSYEVINQFVSDKQDEDDRERRFDVTLLINGLPMIHIELKNQDHPYMDAFRQIKKYSLEGKFRGLFGMVQMFVISNGSNTRYIAADTGSNLNERFLTSWVNKNNEPVENYLEFAKEVLRIPEAHEMVGHYSVVDAERHKLILLRPYQVHAIEAVKQSSQRQESGFVWHTTGSGKTLTSYTVAKNLILIPGIDKTIFLIDRKDLDQQTSISFKMPAEEVEFEAEFRPASEDVAPDVQLSYDDEWHLEWEEDLTVTVDSLSYAKVTTSKLPKGIKLSPVAGTDCEFVLKATKDASKLAPGAYPITITAVNRAGRKTVRKIVMFARNLTAAACLIDGLDTSTGGGYAFEAGVKCSEDLGLTLQRNWSVNSIKGLPPGLKLNTKNFRVTGVPTKAGNYAVTFTVVCKGRKAYKASATFRVQPLNTNVAGTFAGATHGTRLDGEGKAELRRKFSLTAASNGKITAKIGGITLTGTGWKDAFLEEDGSGDWHEAYTATLKAPRKVGKKTYTDVLYVAIDLGASWMEDQMIGTFKTYLGTKIADYTVPSNEDTACSARHNPFACVAEAKEVAAKLAALGTHYVVLDGSEWKVIVGKDGAVRISRTTGTGKNMKTLSASSVVSVDAVKDDPDRYVAQAVFFIAEKPHVIVYDVGTNGASVRE